MEDDGDSGLTASELRDFRRLAGIMVPACAEYGVPGADDAAIFADIIRSLGRDRNDVRKALAQLRELAGEDFGTLEASAEEAAATALLEREGAEIMALGRAVLQCYYRDDRVVRSLGLEPRAVSEGACSGAGRLVPARCGAGAATDVARCRGRGELTRPQASAAPEAPEPMMSTSTISSVGRGVFAPAIVNSARPRHRATSVAAPAPHRAGTNRPAPEHAPSDTARVARDPAT